VEPQLQLFVWGALAALGALRILVLVGLPDFKEGCSRLFDFVEWLDGRWSQFKRSWRDRRR